MTRIELIDRIRAELMRQNRNGGARFAATPGRVPDTFNVIGELDIDALAKAIHDER